MKIWKTESLKGFESLPEGKKIYFVSDFHLGVPDAKDSSQRERNIVRWLASIESDAHAIFLMGDLFDFWFEYKHVVPKGFTRFLGKLASLSDAGVEIIIFTGNHDMWMFGYLRDEIGARIIKGPTEAVIAGKSFFLAHGDGLGNGDALYKFLKAIFESRICQRLFAFLHPAIGMGIAQLSSRSSRMKSGQMMSTGQQINHFTDDRQALYASHLQDLARAKGMPYDYFIMGHYHHVIDMPIGVGRYINTGTWLSSSGYAVYDGQKMEIKFFLSEQS